MKQVIYLDMQTIIGTRKVVYTEEAFRNGIASDKAVRGTGEKKKHQLIYLLCWALLWDYQLEQCN